MKAISTLIQLKKSIYSYYLMSEYIKNPLIDIVAYPNISLSTAGVTIVDFNNLEFIKTVENLIAKMAEYDHCVDLAANQIGSDLNVFVADSSKNKREESKYGFVVVTNPRIVKFNGLIKRREGCMSVPDLTVDITRYENIVVSGQNVTGQEIQFHLDGFESRVFQHEIDHLNGKVILDCAKSSRDIYSRKNYRK